MPPTTKVIWRSRYNSTVVFLEPDNSTSASETVSEQEFEKMRAQEFKIPTFNKPYK